MLQRTKAAVDARKLEKSLRKTILCLYCNVYGISVFGTHIYYNFLFIFAERQFQTIKDKSVDTFEQAKRFLSASFRNFVDTVT